MRVNFKEIITNQSENVFIRQHFKYIEMRIVGALDERILGHFTRTRYGVSLWIDIYALEDFYV